MASSVTDVYLGQGDGALSTSLHLTDTVIWRLRNAGIQRQVNGDGTITLTLPLRVQAATADAYLDQIAVLQGWLLAAERIVATGSGDWVALSVKFAGRASNWTYFDVLSGVADFPDTFPPDNQARGTLMLVCLGAGRVDPAVIENYLLQSEDLNTTWTKLDATVTVNAVAAPNGTTTADKIVEAATTAVHQIHQTATVANATGTYTFQGYFKPAQVTKVQLALADIGGSTVPAQCIFDLSAGTAGTPTAGTASITLDQNGFYLCAVTGTVAHTNLDGYITLVTGTNTTNYAGNTANGLYGWGIQLAESPRVAPYLRVAASRTWTNGDAPLAIYGVGGDAEALVQARLATTAARARVSRRAHNNAVAADWSPWVDLTGTGGGASNVVDATAFGGAYKRRAVTLASWLDIATVTLPTGIRDYGRADIWARVRDTPVAIAAPTSLTATLNDPAVSAPTSTAVPSGTILQTKKGGTSGSGASGNVTAASNSPTTAGSALIACVTVRDNSPAGNTYTIVPPAAMGLTLVKEQISPSTIGHMWFYLAENSASVAAGTKTWAITRASGTATWDGAVIWHEVATTVASGAINAFLDQTFSATDVSFSIDPTNAGNLLLGFVWANTAFAAATPSLYLGGETVIDTQGALQSFDRMAVDDSAVSMTAIYTTVPTNAIVMIAAISLTPSTTTAAGALTAGAYSGRVQAVDISGGLSNATVSATVTVVNGVAAITYAWGAPATGVVASYLLTVSAPGSVFYTFSTSSLSYVLTTLSVGAAASALPALTGATPSFNRFRATLNGAALDVEVVMTVSNVWAFLHFGTGLLGATARALAGEQGGGTLAIQVYSGGGSSAPCEADCVFLAAHDEPGLTIETTDLLASTGLLVAETDRRLTRTLGWEAPTSAGGATTVTSAAATVGVLSLAPGENLVSMELDGAASVSDLTLTCIPAFQVWQRSRLGKGLS